MNSGVCFSFGERDPCLSRGEILSKEEINLQEKDRKPQKARCNFTNCVLQK